MHSAKCVLLGWALRSQVKHLNSSTLLAPRPASRYRYSSAFCILVNVAIAMALRSILRGVPVPVSPSSRRWWCTK
jgi:hypothetical protein